MQNTRPKKVLLAVASILLAFFIGEVAARWLLPASYRWLPTHRPYAGVPGLSPPGNLPAWGVGWVLSVPDPQIGWVLSPAPIEKQQHMRASDGSSTAIVYSINHGERRTSAQPPSGPVIVIAGDSSTFGYYLGDQDTWPWLLQERMPDYHIINVAAPGYGTDQALLAAERKVDSLPGQVRAVVLGFADYQLDRNRAPQSWLWTIYPASKPLFAPDAAGGVQYKGQVKYWSLGSLADSIIEHSVLLSRLANLIADRLVYRIEQHDGARQLTVALITEFARRFQSRGVRLAVVVLPYVGDHSPTSRADREAVVGQLRAAGVPTLAIDIPRLPDGRMRAEGFTVGMHPNGRYNSLLADQLAPFLTALNAPAGHAPD